MRSRPLSSPVSPRVLARPCARRFWIGFVSLLRVSNGVRYALLAVAGIALSASLNPASAADTHPVSRSIDTDSRVFGRVFMPVRAVSNGLLGLPALSRHVPRVVARGSEKEMRWVNARWIVTSVQNQQVTGESAVMQSPRNTVRPLMASVEFDLPVTVLVFARSPRPAAVRLADFRPKPINLTLVFHSVKLTHSLWKFTSFVGGVDNS